MYQVAKSKSKEELRYIKENGKLLFAAMLRSYKDYYEEVVKGENECATQIMSFTTMKGNKFIVWYDVETEEYFITKIKDGNEQ